MNFGLVAVFLFSVIVANGQARVRPEIQENTKVEIYRSLEDLLNDKVDETITADFECYLYQRNDLLPAIFIT